MSTPLQREVITDALQYLFLMIQAGRCSITSSELGEDIQRPVKYCGQKTMDCGPGASPSTLRSKVQLIALVGPCEFCAVYAHHP
jgi:hypothetical protein